MVDMYGNFVKQDPEHPQKVLIMDTVHGGAIIAERILPLGYKVVCADVYGVSTEELMEDVRKKGATAVRDVPKDHYDLVLAPMHCPDDFLEGSTYDEKLSFSGAVNRLVGSGPTRIEVTGVKGKTSTCYVLAHILDKAGLKVYLHTSRGDGRYFGGTHLVEAFRSIAPTSILVLPDEGYDVVISEVSLGGSAKADISVITNLAEDYGIAKNSRKASCAKAEILTDRINWIMSSEKDIWEKYGKPLSLHTDCIKVVGEPRIGEALEITFRYQGDDHIVKLDGSYLSLQYLQAMDMALSVCKSLNIGLQPVIAGLATFKGVPGRGEIKDENGVWHVTERNPGISHISVGRTMGCLKAMGALDGAFAIVDPVSKKVCDKMRPQQIKDVIDSYGVPVVFTDGINREVPIPEGTKTVIRFIKEGFQ